MQRIIIFYLCVVLLGMPLLSGCGSGSNTNPAVTCDDRGTRPFGRPFAGRAMAYGQNGMAASSSILATETAIEILKAGGSAVDAAIAANAVLGIVEPHMCGVGGDMFAILWDPEAGAVRGINASGPSSLSVSYDMMAEHAVDGAMPLVGPHTVTVPGTVDGWIALHEQYGKLPLEQVLAPAIRYAGEGVIVTQSAASLWGLGLVELEEMGADPAYMEELNAIFYAGGEAPAEGSLFRNPALANTYRQIAASGRDGFYDGIVGAAISSTLSRYGAVLTDEDLRQYRSEWVEPISTDYRGYEIYELPPNGQGVTALELMNILENYDLHSMGRDSSQFWHIFMEAKKLAYEDRPLYVADPAFEQLPVETLLSKEYAAARAAQIDPSRANPDVQPGPVPSGKGDTTYITVADQDGMMISMIQSVYGLMGSGIAVSEGGFVLQNRGALFSLAEASPNVYAPGKRPYHTIIPAMVTKDDQPFLSFGVCGGDYQPMGHAQFLVNVIDFDYNIQESIDAARIRHTGQTDPATLERPADGFMAELGICTGIVDELIAKGHPFIRQDTTASDLSGSMQAILYDADSGSYRGASEMRADGCAIGY